MKKIKGQKCVLEQARYYPGLVVYLCVSKKTSQKSTVCHVIGYFYVIVHMLSLTGRSLIYDQDMSSQVTCDLGKDKGFAVSLIPGMLL